MRTRELAVATLEAPGSEATISERQRQRQLDALVVKHAVLTLALQEPLRRTELPAASSLGRALPARVAALVQAVADEGNAAAVHEAAKNNLHGLLHALWQR